MKRSLIALLCMVILFFNFSGCAENNDQTNEAVKPVDTTEAETADPYDDEIPDTFDYAGETFSIACPKPEDLGCIFYDRDELNGDVLNDAIYTRNTEIEQRFNVIIDTFAAGYTDAQYKDLTPMLLAGDDSVDLIALGFMQGGAGMVTSGFAMPWNDVPFVNTDKPWWNQNITESLAINDKIYILVGDINWTTMCETAVCFFNKPMAADYNIANLYTKVKDGKWNFDELYAIASQIPADIDGDGKFTKTDKYGCIQNKIVGIYSFVSAANYHTVYKGSGEFTMNILTDKMQSIVDYVYKLCYENNTSYVDNFDYAKDSEGVKIFFDNRALFMLATLEHGEYFRSFDSDFGILPYPKYDDAQEQYCSTSDQWGLSCVMPSTASDPEFNGIITEALCAASSKYIAPAYYEKVLLGKHTRDDESGEMLDIVFDNLIYDFGTSYCTNLNLIVLTSLINAKSTDLSSWYAKNESKMLSNYQSIYDYAK